VNTRARLSQDGLCNCVILGVRMVALLLALLPCPSFDSHHRHAPEHYAAAKLHQKRQLKLTLLAVSLHVLDNRNSSALTPASIYAAPQTRPSLRRAGRECKIRIPPKRRSPECLIAGTQPQEMVRNSGEGLVWQSPPITQQVPTAPPPRRSYPYTSPFELVTTRPSDKTHPQIAFTATQW
jgi:hypothetical protein